MIDTDKYEGHTEDKETWSKYANWATARYLRDADEQLIADAPLLLAEVERLREQVKDLEYEVENWKGELAVRMHYIDYDALVNGGKKE
tara:strand:- start:574 stop:837 length:264 start_codon:yes stop_codon:yes gene_type:complete